MSVDSGEPVAPQLGTCSTNPPYTWESHLKTGHCINWRPVEQASVSPPTELIVRCSKCKGTLIHKRIAANEIEVFHTCAPVDIQGPESASAEKWEIELGPITDIPMTIPLEDVKYMGVTYTIRYPSGTFRVKQRVENSKAGYSEAYERIARIVGEHREDKSAPAQKVGENCYACGRTIRPTMGPGDYSCVSCGFGMVEPCEHWKASIARGEVGNSDNAASAGEPTEAGKPADYDDVPAISSANIEAAREWRQINWYDSVPAQLDLALATYASIYAASLQPQVAEAEKPEETTARKYADTVQPHRSSINLSLTPEGFAYHLETYAASLQSRIVGKPQVTKAGLRAKFREGWMDSIDFDDELGHAAGGNVVYPDEQDLRNNRKCLDTDGYCTTRRVYVIDADKFDQAGTHAHLGSQKIQHPNRKDEK